MDGLGLGTGTFRIGLGLQDRNCFYYNIQFARAGRPQVTRLVRRTVWLEYDICIFCAA